MYVLKETMHQHSRAKIEPKMLSKILPPPELSNQEKTVNIKINTSHESLTLTPEAIPLQDNPRVMTENPKRSLRPSQVTLLNPQHNRKQVHLRC